MYGVLHLAEGPRAPLTTTPNAAYLLALHRQPFELRAEPTIPAHSSLLEVRPAVPPLRTPVPAAGQPWTSPLTLRVYHLHRATTIS